MFSWLNFEELLIHNPIEFINPSKDTISVAMNKKQYIEFFSNKYTYNGLYYDEEMDFCLFYYADPLQSYKEGDVYAQGYIDVEMKIYRVKWLCNVSISRFKANGNFNLLTDSKEFKNKNVAISALTTSISSRDSTIVKEGNETYLHFSKTSSNNSDWFRAFLVGEKNTNFPNVDLKGNTKYTFSVWLKGTGEHTIYAYPGWTEPWNANKTITLTKEWKLYTFTVLTRSKNELNTKHAIQFFIRSNNVGTEIDLKKPKVEEGPTATPYMQAESETTRKWNVSKTEMVVNSKSKAITTVLNGALAKCTQDKNVTGWQNLLPNANYKYRQPQYSLDIGADNFIISGFGLRGLKNG
mgnify:CR=1 FL=1|nr:MAG TPA: Minor structural protein 4 [Caudoviricetes sp.]